MELEKDLSQKRQYLDYDRYKIPVTSVAVLADNSPLWNPPPFQYGMWGSTMGLDYLKTKLLDYKDKWLYLENHDNPFAIVVMAHLKALETRKDHLSRKQWKIGLKKAPVSKRLFKNRGFESLRVYRLGIGLAGCA
jgi:hypothetical protein